MWARVNAASVQQENAVNMMQIDMLQLNVLATQLDNVSMQATLIIGFALGMWAGETLDPLLDDVGPHCIYKSGVANIIAFVFFSSVALCITYCFVVVVLSSYVKQASQAAALLVCTGAAVAKTRLHIGYIYDCFVYAVGFFIVSATLLVWLFVGLPARIPFDPPKGEDDGQDDEEVTLLYNGHRTISCLDRHSPEHNEARDRLSIIIATANTLIILGMCLHGYRVFRQVRQSFEPKVLLVWWTEYKTEQAELHDAIRVENTKQHRGIAPKKRHVSVADGVRAPMADTYYAAHSGDEST